MNESFFLKKRDVGAGGGLWSGGWVNKQTRKKTMNTTDFRKWLWNSVPEKSLEDLLEIVRTFSAETLDMSEVIWKLTYSIRNGHYGSPLPPVAFEVLDAVLALKGVDIDAPFFFYPGFTPLTYAVCDGWRGGFDSAWPVALLDRGASVEEGLGVDFFVRVVKTGNPAFVRKVLATVKGACLKTFSTSLMQAAVRLVLPPSSSSTKRGVSADVFREILAALRDVDAVSPSMCTIVRAADRPSHADVRNLEAVLDVMASYDPRDYLDAMLATCLLTGPYFPVLMRYFIAKMDLRRRDEAAILQAAFESNRNGREEMVKRMLDKKRLSSCLTTLRNEFRREVEFGWCEPVKWLWSLGLGGSITSGDMQWAFRESCRLGRLHMAKLLLSLGRVDVHADDDSAFRYACDWNHLETAKWVHALGGVDVHAWDDYAFIESCRSGRLEIAQWLWSLGGVELHGHDDFAFRIACNNGHLETAQWLWSLGGVDHHVDHDEAFRLACKQGYAAIAQWVWSLGGVDLHAEDDFAFRMACGNDNLAFAQWLWSLGGVNICARPVDGVTALVFACERGKQETVKWLVTLGGVNIHDADDLAYRAACLQGRYETARFLVSMDPQWPWDLSPLKRWKNERASWIHAACLSV